MSLIISGLITISLGIHWFLRRKKLGDASGEEIRVQGARFLLGIMLFSGLLALQALIFSRIEGWTYIDGIYFSLITAFTIGFGDFSPTKVSTQILNFPFAVLSIALLAVMIGQIIEFMTDRARARKAQYKDRFEEEFEKKRAENDEVSRRSLVMEVAELNMMERQENRYNQLFDLSLSATSLVIFWLIGATIFSQIEGYAFGTGLYFMVS